jgi:hypothetical protein
MAFSERLPTMKPKHPRDPNQFAKDGSKEAASVGGLFPLR